MCMMMMLMSLCLVGELLLMSPRDPAAAAAAFGLNAERCGPDDEDNEDDDDDDDDGEDDGAGSC